MATEFYPLLPARWNDLEKIFGKKGAIAGCWCMYWRLPRAEWQKGRGEPNRLALKAIVESGTVPGLLAYHDNEPVGWCAIQPREAYPALDGTKMLVRIDNEPVWSIPCFYVPRLRRRQGLMRDLLGAAIEWTGQNGAQIIEAYPFELDAGVKHTWGYCTGYPPPFLEAGFAEVTRRSKRRPIMRKYLH